MLKPSVAQVLLSTLRSLQALAVCREAVDSRAGALAGILLQCRVSIYPEKVIDDHAHGHRPHASAHLRFV